MTDALTKVSEDFVAALRGATDAAALEELRVRFLGKKGELTCALRQIGKLPEEERPAYGERANVLRHRIESELDDRRCALSAEAERAALAAESEDIGLPGRVPVLGALHPLRRVERRMVEIFRRLGYWVATGPDVETDYFNFEALNFPPDHPARDMQDTLFLNGGLLLRTHTSPVQIRAMNTMPPPLRLVIPGRVYRHDSDATHSPVFHQVEGLCVGPDITFAHLKGTLSAFVRRMFGRDVATRFRPSFFPFTEPSAEVDMACGGCRGRGCRVCKNSGWIEILGCGMVDPNVFEAVGKTWGAASPYDPERVSGFAFGMGIERVAMVLHGIDDIRLFYENDLRFLSQFRSWL